MILRLKWGSDIMVGGLSAHRCHFKCFPFGITEPLSSWLKANLKECQAGITPCLFHTRAGLAFSDRYHRLWNIAICATTVHHDRLSDQVPLRSVWSAHHGSVCRIIDWIPRPLRKICQLLTTIVICHLSHWLSNLLDNSPLTPQSSKRQPHCRKQECSRTYWQLTTLKGYELSIVKLLHTCRQALPLLASSFCRPPDSLSFRHGARRHFTLRFVIRTQDRCATARQNVLRESKSPYRLYSVSLAENKTMRYVK